jgi:hypothetical protein
MSVATAGEIISKAESYIGTKESPPYSDNVIFNTDYYGHPVYSTATTKYHWCLVYPWDIFRMCGASDLFYDGKKTASCTTFMNWAISKGLEVPRDQGRMGDLIFFDWDGSGDADHVGFIKSGLNNGYYTTIEGNTSLSDQSNGGEVMLRYRKLDKTVRAIIRPRYEVDNLKYRAYVQGIGYMPWQESGGTAGTVGQGKRMEAIQFDMDSQITVQCHCQGYGDMKPVYAGNIAGTVGESKRMESIKIDAPYKIECRVHVQGKGWLPWVKNGEWTGTKGESRRIEAIEVKRV